MVTKHTTEDTHRKVIGDNHTEVCWSVFTTTTILLHIYWGENDAASQLVLFGRPPIFAYAKLLFTVYTSKNCSILLPSSGFSFVKEFTFQLHEGFIDQS